MLIDANIYVDASGAEALYAFKGQRFACNFVANETIVRPLSSGRVNPKALGLAKSAYRKDILAHLTPDWLARHVALYA